MSDAGKRVKAGTDRMMTAMVLSAPKTIVMQTVPIPVPGPREVRVRLQGCGVCASNLPPWEGRQWFTYPFEPGQMGHEGWGIVDDVGSEVTFFRPGQRVAMLSQKAYAQYDVAPQEMVVPLPDELGDEAFPGEPLGCAMNIFRRSGITSGATVAIIGVGFLGSLLTRLASGAGARVLAIARRPASQEVARAMGAAKVIPMDDHWKIIEKVRQLTSQKMCDVVIEAVGQQWPLDLAGELTCERGRLVVAGYHQDGPRQVNMQMWNWRGIDVINAHERDPRVYIDGIRAAMAAVASGQIAPSRLYTHRYPLARLADALRDTQSREGNFMKALLVM